jgi:hypothetical protein
MRKMTKSSGAAGENREKKRGAYEKKVEKTKGDDKIAPPED